MIRRNIWILLSPDNVNGIHGKVMIDNTKLFIYFAFTEQYKTSEMFIFM